MKRARLWWNKSIWVNQNVQLNRSLKDAKTISNLQQRDRVLPAIKNSRVFKELQVDTWKNKKNLLSHKHFKIMKIVISISSHKLIRRCDTLMKARPARCIWINFKVIEWQEMWLGSTLSNSIVKSTPSRSHCLNGYHFQFRLINRRLSLKNSRSSSQWDLRHKNLLISQWSNPVHAKINCWKMDLRLIICQEKRSQMKKKHSSRLSKRKQSKFFKWRKKSATSNLNRMPETCRPRLRIESLSWMRL